MFPASSRVSQTGSSSENQLLYLATNFSSLLPHQVAARLRDFATMRAMESAHSATAAGAGGDMAALALRSGESGKPCKLRMRSAQVRPHSIYYA